VKRKSDWKLSNCSFGRRTR